MSISTRRSSATSISRREFVAACAAGAILSDGISMVRAAESTPRLKVGFLGTGHSHFKDKYLLLRDSPGWELVGLCEENEAVRAKGPPGARWLSAAELFAAVDVVVVESAVQQHASDA